MQALEAQLQAINAEIAALAGKGSDDPQNASQLAALTAQAATISTEIAQAASSAA